jgi:hypothetical protein
VILTTFDDADAELIDTNGATRGSSDVSALINHYRAFSNTLQANSAIGIVEPPPTGFICGGGNERPDEKLLPG